jgi:hypothetical protein
MLRNRVGLFDDWFLPWRPRIHRNTKVGLILTILHTYIHTYINTCTSNRSFGWRCRVIRRCSMPTKASAAIESDHTNTNLRARHQQARQAHTLSQQGTHSYIHTYICTYIIAYIHTYIHVLDLLAYILPANIHTQCYVRAYIHAYILQYNSE